MHLSIVTPEKKIFDDEINSLTVRTTNGEITVLPQHVDLLTTVTPGEVTIRKDNKEQYMAVTGGFLEVTKSGITILADYAVRSEDIEVEKAMQAQKRAQEVLKKKEESISERDLAVAQADLRRSILELKVAQRRRRTT